MNMSISIGICGLYRIGALLDVFGSGVYWPHTGMRHHHCRFRNVEPPWLEVKRAATVQMSLCIDPKDAFIALVVP